MALLLASSMPFGSLTMSLALASSSDCSSTRRWIGPEWLRICSEPSGGMSTSVPPVRVGTRLSLAWNGPRVVRNEPPSSTPRITPAVVTARIPPQRPVARATGWRWCPRCANRCQRVTTQWGIPAVRCQSPNS